LNEETDDEAIEVQRETDHRHSEGASGKHGASEPTFYKWRSKYGGLEVSEAKRLRALEEENAKLKKLLAESMMDVSTLREMLGKNF
jgi:putative transposase